MRTVPMLELIGVLLLHQISRTDADGEGSTSGIVTELDCGSTLFTNASGMIVLPMNPTGKKGTSVNCTYVISANRTSQISINFFSVARQTIDESFGNCFNESITISCIAGDFPSGIFCLAKQRSSPIFVNCRLLKLSVRSENYNVKELLEIPYSVIDENECGTTSFSGPIGVVTSPRFPLSYPHNLSCIYSIEVGGGRSKSIAIAFLSFNLEGTSRTPVYDTCIHDYLTISCLSEIPSPDKLPPARKYCGQKSKPPKFTFSDCAYVILNLFSDSSISQGGFKLQYTSPAPELECGQTLFTNSSGVITMPSNPTYFLAKVNCTYTISTNHLYRMSLGASSFLTTNYLQSFKDCRKEMLTISCISNFTTNRRVLCASSSSVDLSTLFSSCQRLTISIISTQYEHRGLFSIAYRAVDVDADCGSSSFSGPIGFITSPRFPLSYPHSLNCIYTIAVGRMKTVELHFISFFLEGPSSSGVCLHDWLTISCLSEGSIASTDSSSVKKHCDRKPTIQMLKFSDCDALLLNFVTDSTVTHGGFKIQYTIKQTDNSTSNATDTNLPDLDCGDTVFTNSSGVITLPSNPTGYLAKVNCSYTISTDRRSKISVNISLIEMRKLVDSFRNCTNENLMVECVSERTPSFSTARVFCQNTFSRIYPFLLTQMTFPNCQKLRLSVRSSNYGYRGTFRISYTAVANDAECGNTSFTDPTGVIASPKFPLSYPHGLNCIYSIDIGGRETISLRFLSFNLEGVSSVNGTDTCIHDWLTMSCSSEGSTAETNPSSNRKYCGLKPTPLKFSFSNCSTLMLNFVTDASVTRGGFLVQYKVTPPLEVICGIPIYHRPSGVITSSWNYPDYGESFNCTYVINATKPSSISLTIWSISPKSSVGRNCHSDWLLMTCLDDQTELDHKVNHRSCNYLNSSTALTFPRCRAVQLVFHRDFESTGKTFRIEYTVNDYATSDTTRSDSTTFTSVQKTSQAIHQTTTTVTSERTTSDASKSEITTATSEVLFTVSTTLEVIQPLTTTISSSVPTIVQTTSVAIESETTTSTSDKSIISQTTKCDIRCSEIRTGDEITDDRSTCNCPSTQSGELFVNTPLSSTTADNYGYSFFIPIALTVIAIVVVVFILILLFRRKFRLQDGQEILLEEMEEDILHVGRENGDATTSRSPMNDRRLLHD